MLLAEKSKLAKRAETGIGMIRGAGTNRSHTEIHRETRATGSKDYERRNDEVVGSGSRRWQRNDGYRSMTWKGEGRLTGKIEKRNGSDARKVTEADLTGDKRSYDEGKKGRGGDKKPEG